jgi:hypothetical protein
MSRNSKRTQVPRSKKVEVVPPQKAVSPPIPQEKPNPFGLSFAVATEIVHLPSGGRFYEEGSALNGLDRIEIKSMTAKEEDILINDSFIREGTVADRLINSLMITPGVRAEELLDCDKIAALVSARKTGFGDALEINYDCAECGVVSEVELSLSAMLENAKNAPYELKDTDDWSYDENSETLVFNLPVTNLETRIRILSKEDNEYLKTSREKKEQLNLPHNDTIEFLRRAIVSVNGITDLSDISKLLEVLPAADGRRIKYIHNVNVPSFDTTQEVTCPNCSAVAEKEVPFSVGWFWSN